MARKHIEFSQSANVDQQPWSVKGLSEGAMTRILSIDDETGDSTELVHWSECWEGDSGYFTCDVEIFVLKQVVNLEQILSF